MTPCPHHFGPGACHDCAVQRVGEAVDRREERRKLEQEGHDETKKERQSRLARLSDAEWEAAR